MSSTTTAAAPEIHFFSCYSDALNDSAPLPASQVSASKGVLRADPTHRVLTRVRTNGITYLFARIPLSELAGATAFDVWLTDKGRFRVFACLPHGSGSPPLLRLTLESYGAWPEEGAPPEKLVNITSQKMWPAYLQA